MMSQACKLCPSAFWCRSALDNGPDFRWLISFIPLIVASVTGGTIEPYLADKDQIATLTVSFLMWTVGSSMSYMILTIYFWRLMYCQLPQRGAIMSCFIPVGPLGKLLDFPLNAIKVRLNIKLLSSTKKSQKHSSKNPAKCTFFIPSSSWALPCYSHTTDHSSFQRAPH